MVALEIPIGTYHKSISGEEGSIFLNQPRRDKSFYTSKDFTQLYENQDIPIHTLPISYKIDEKKIVSDPIGHKAQMLTVKWYVISISKDQLKNIHDLCKVGGIMYHVVPKENNWDGARAGLNHPHCPYYYTSEFFSELAESNGYEMVVNKVWNHDEAKPQRAREECVCVFKKVNNNEFIKLDNFPESMLRRI